MSKRFSDSDKWKKKWFRNLSALHKSFWLYLIDNCNHAGIWEVDWELAQMFFKEKIEEEEIKIAFKKQYKELQNGKKWLIIDFVSFQYGELNPENKVHKSIISLLRKEGDIKTLSSPYIGDKDKDKDKGKDKGNISATKDESVPKEPAKTKNAITSKQQQEIFDNIWKRYPNNDGKKLAFTHFKVDIKNNEDWKKINKALSNYLNCKKVKAGYIKNGSTWFNNWKDWIDYKEKGKDDWMDKVDEKIRKQREEEKEKCKQIKQIKETN